MTPLLSVVIPTHKRPALLERAIASALELTRNADSEVVIVPNGFDDSWKVVAERFKNDLRARWLPLPVGNACAARNHGLANARGKYVRFLDDDDYLSRAAVDQLTLIEQQSLDICSAPLESVLPDGGRQLTFCLPASNDFATTAVLSIGISGFTQGSIFKRDLIRDSRWREDVVLYDDYFWMLDLAATREMAWLQTSEPVGAYVQHDGSRLSRVRRSGQNSRALVNAILQFHGHLKSTGRITPERSSAVATALMTHAHSAFPASPFFLASVIQRATAIDPGAAPLQPVFQQNPWLAGNLSAVEWAMLAPRYLTRGYRRASWSVRKLLAPPSI